VLGVERGMEVVSRLQGVEAVVVDAEGRIYYSDGLTPPQ
jgi:thiamine biosynthesis lipoprotein